MSIIVNISKKNMKQEWERNLVESEKIVVAKELLTGND
jgi:hypothetical protein